MKKVIISPETIIEDLQINSDRAPNYLGLRLDKLDFIVPSSSKVVKTTNHPRKVEKKSGNCDQISASLKRGWAVGSFPPSFIENNGSIQLLNGRHTLEAFLQSQYYRMPAAIYTRVPSGDKDFDSLSVESQDMINGMRANVDGTCNAVKDDFEYVANKVITTDNLKRNEEVVEQILNWCNIHERYNWIGTKNEIRNKVLNFTKGQTSAKVFNTTVEERDKWMKDNPEFGENNTSAEEYKLRSTCVDEKSIFRDYAYRIYNSALEAAETNTIEKRIIWSSSTHEDQIKRDRDKIVSMVYKCHDRSRNYFFNFIKSELGKIPFFEKISLPKCELDILPLELWAGPQIDGETKAIRLI
jgi:hypothetical protein